MVLSFPEGELGLQEEVIPAHQSALHCRQDRLANRSLVIVTALVSGVDPPKSRPQSGFDQLLCPILFPRRPVQEAGNWE